MLKPWFRSSVNLRNGLAIPKSSWVRLETESFVTELEMEISDSQTQDLGVIHLDKMPDSSEALQSHKPELIPPSDSLA